MSEKGAFSDIEKRDRWVTMDPPPDGDMSPSLLVTTTSTCLAHATNVDNIVSTMERTHADATEALRDCIRGERRALMSLGESVSAAEKNALEAVTLLFADIADGLKLRPNLEAMIVRGRWAEIRLRLLELEEQWRRTTGSEYEG
jgi:hypothetical protein